MNTSKSPSSAFVRRAITSRLSLEVQSWEGNREAFGKLPTYWLSAITGPGAAVVAVGDDDDPPVVYSEFPSAFQGSMLIAALRTSRYLEGLFLPPEFGPFAVLPADAPTTRVVVAGNPESVASNAVLREFDTLFNSLLGVPLSSRGTFPVSLDQIVSDNYYNTFPARPDPKMITPMILRTRYTPVVAMTMLIATARVWHREGTTGAVIRDDIGLFNQGPGTSLSIDEAADALLTLAVDGDLDDLGLAYRRDVAVPLNRHHQFWPID